MEELIQEKAAEKRRLEGLIMHKEQFKGTGTYYESKLVIGDLLEGIKERESGGRGELGDGELVEFSDVLGEGELKRLLGDRDVKDVA